MNRQFEYLCYRVRAWSWRPARLPNRLSGYFSATLRGIRVRGDRAELARFAMARYEVEDIDVEALHDSIKWEMLSKGVHGTTRRELALYHMRLVVAADLRFPIIVAVNEHGDVASVLDGYHRIKKAFMLGRVTIGAYRIPEEDLLSWYTTEDTQKAEQFS